MAFTLMSPAFKSGSVIPARHSCDGDNISPALAWSGAPSGTRGFALVCEDPDAPAGAWYHWAIYDIAPGASALAEGYAGGRGSEKQALNDFRRRKYDGPCPPHGHGKHHYRFTLYALDTAELGVKRDAHCRDVEAAARAHALARAELVGLYAR